MATVYLAEDQRLGRKVAVKRLHSDSPEDAAQRFEREAKVGASLSHPNLVTVFDTVADDEGVLIVMEYVAGENLAQLMGRERVPAEQAVSILRQVAGALDHAHQAGVVHRDIKPANILISPDGKAKLVDLGIATASERTQITQAGTVLGTPSYMAPEQLEGGKITKAVDIYALGAVAFELLSGRKARQGRTPVEIAHQIASKPSPDIREAWSDAPPAAAEAVQRAMARDPRQRPRSAGQLARSLDDAFKATQPAATRPLPRSEERPVVAAAVAPAPTPPAPSPPPAPAVQPAPPRQRPPAPLGGRERRGLPRWIPVALIVAMLLVAAGAIAALSSGGNDKGTAAVVPATTKTPAKHKKKTSTSTGSSTSQSTTTQQQPTGSPTTPATTTPAPQAASGDPVQMQAQAHSLINQGQYAQAITLDKQVVAQGPGSGLTYAYALFDLGHALRVSGHPDQAIPILEQRLKINNQRGVVKAELDKAKAEAGSG
ncbi:MAG: eukaryotic-like serine/threonine-protein kinase [Thermoleophilaceae bacterium]|nr:eukaryotic-like serine/threonine-protein kinase [Thermoleophilaceae bacterium]